MFYLAPLIITSSSAISQWEFFILWSSITSPASVGAWNSVDCGSAEVDTHTHTHSNNEIITFEKKYNLFLWHSKQTLFSWLIASISLITYSYFFLQEWALVQNVFPKVLSTKAEGLTHSGMRWPLPQPWTSCRKDGDAFSWNSWALSMLNMLLFSEISSESLTYESAQWNAGDCMASKSFKKTDPCFSHMHHCLQVSTWYIPISIPIPMGWHNCLYKWMCVHYMRTGEIKLGCSEYEGQGMMSDGGKYS